jgi:hypothetical protein
MLGEVSRKFSVLNMEEFRDLYIKKIKMDWTCSSNGETIQAYGFGGYKSVERSRFELREVRRLSEPRSCTDKCGSEDEDLFISNVMELCQLKSCIV